MILQLSSIPVPNTDLPAVIDLGAQASVHAFVARFHALARSLQAQLNSAAVYLPRLRAPRLCNMVISRELHRRFHVDTGIVFSTLYPGS